MVRPRVPRTVRRPSLGGTWGCRLRPAPRVVFSPVSVWDGPNVGPVPSGPNHFGALVGRTEELEALQDAFDASADGLVVVLVAGDPGVGKTALAQAFAQHCRGRDIPVHWGACSEIGGAPAFWPWIQVLRSIGAEALVAAEAGLDAHADQPFPAFHAVHQELRLRATERRVLVLDDLHRADLPSLHLLRYLTSSASELPLLVIGNHRLHELRIDRARDAALSEIGSRGRRIIPSALGQSEVSSLLAAVVEGEPDGQVVAEVLARTGGNALYVEQLVDAVGRQGVAGLDGLPDGIRAAVRARLEPLPEAARDLLALASVLGDRVRVPLLATLAGVSVARVQAHLAMGVTAGIVMASGDDVRFTHALVQDTLNDELDPEDRRRAHAVAAAALVDRPGVAPAVIAQHLLDAGDMAEPEEVARWAGSAAAAARRIGGHREAGRWAELAAEWWGRSGDLDAPGDHLVAAIADFVTAGDGRRAIELAADLAELARARGSGQLLARAALARAAVFEPNQDVDGPPLLREALDHPDLGPAADLRADLLSGLASLVGMPSVDGGRRDEPGARAALAELEGLASAGDRHSKGRLAEARLNVESGPLFHLERFDWLTSFEEILPAGSNALARVQRLYWATSLAFEAGDLPSVDRFLREWEILADRCESAFWMWRAAMARASLLYAQGQLDRAEAQAQDRADLVASLHPEMASRVGAGLVFAIRRDQGRLHELAGIDPAALGLLGVLVTAERGDGVEARRQLSEVVAAAESTGPDDLQWLCLVSLVATAADSIGDAVRGRWAADQLDPFAEQCVMWGRSYVFGMPVSEAIGLGRRVAGQPAEAAAAFRCAVAWADRVGAPGFGARARINLASVLEPDDPERTVLAGEGRAVAARLGLVAVEAQALALVGSADGKDQHHSADIGSDRSSGSAAVSRVRTLGRFEVVGVGRAEPSRWSSRKARDALKILICRRGGAISREELIDALWPDVDLASGRTRLSVVLSLLRSALDPDRRFGSDPLRADRQSVALDLHLVSVDVEALLSRADHALGLSLGAEPDAVELEAALELAEAGTFLAEDPYADFAAPLRRVVERTHRDLVHTLARCHGADENHTAAVYWAHRLVELDPADADSHDRLVALLQVEGRRVEVEAVQSARRAWLDGPG